MPHPRTDIQERNRRTVTRDPGLQLLVRTACENARRIVTEAALLQDLRERQLSVLRNTYPAWEIDVTPDRSGRAWWTAVLRRAFTLDLATAGVVQTVRQDDAIALAATLAWQSSLLPRAPR